MPWRHTCTKQQATSHKQEAQTTSIAGSGALARGKTLESGKRWIPAGLKTGVGASVLACGLLLVNVGEPRTPVMPDISMCSRGDTVVIRCSRCSKIQATVEAWMQHRQVCNLTRDDQAQPSKSAEANLNRLNKYLRECEGRLAASYRMRPA